MFKKHLRLPRGTDNGTEMFSDMRSRAPNPPIRSVPQHCEPKWTGNRNDKVSASIQKARQRRYGFSQLAGAHKRSEAATQNACASWS